MIKPIDELAWDDYPKTPEKKLKEQSEPKLTRQKSKSPLKEDKDMLEDYLILTLNKAIAKATNVNETELAAVAKEGMPNIPGLDMFK